MTLPSGTVTFLFTDVEGSTRLLHELGAEGYADVLAEHRRVIREACSRHDGVEGDTQGDAFFFAFPTAPGALAAAQETREARAPRHCGWSRWPGARLVLHGSARRDRAHGPRRAPPQGPVRPRAHLPAGR